MVKVGVIGGGGREHALGESLAQDAEVSEVIYFPGNGGTQSGKGRNVVIDPTKEENWDAIVEVVKRENIDMVVIGPEKPLSLGFADFLNSQGYNRVFGASKMGSRLEADKFFSYEVMKVLEIPQAQARKCTTFEQSEIAIRKLYKEGKNAVIKARGLTEGKGVSVCGSLDEALAELQSHVTKYGPEALIAERLYGQEFSVFGICDGKDVLPIDVSFQDHKRRDDNDEGPNTGGMGAYGPVPFAPASVVRDVAERVMRPVVRYMGENGYPYKGFLYAGMIMTKEGPKVLEFNVRFGDPECQPAMMMLRNGIYRPLSLALEGRLSEARVEFLPGAACCVVLASRRYPGDYKANLGLEISGIESANSIPGVKVFHAGTRKEGLKILTSGGRVLGVTAYSPEGIEEAQKLAYQGVEKISVPGGFQYRKDIANQALKK